MLKKKIVFTGGTGRFGTVLLKKYDKLKFKILFPSKKELNILDTKLIRKYLILVKLLKSIQTLILFFIMRIILLIMLKRS